MVKVLHSYGIMPPTFASPMHSKTFISPPLHKSVDETLNEFGMVSVLYTLQYGVAHAHMNRAKTEALILLRYCIYADYSW